MEQGKLRSQIKAQSSLIFFKVEPLLKIHKTILLNYASQNHVFSWENIRGEMRNCVFED